MSLMIVVGAYIVAALQTFLISDMHPLLSAQQISSSFLTLTLAWIIFAIRWRRSDALLLLKVLSLTALASVGLGLFLQMATAILPGLDASVLTNRANTYRLQGASIPAWLAMTGTASACASVILFKLTRQSHYIRLTMMNVIIVCATVSRTAILAVAIVSIPLVLDVVRGNPKLRQNRTLRTFGALAIAALLLLLTMPLVTQRNTVSGSSFATEESTLNTSGREQAWSEYFAAGLDEPAFGRGLGSTFVIEVSNRSFQAPHNEYLRIFVESGYVGMSIIFAAFVAALLSTARQTPAHLRRVLWTLVIALALLSLTDNALSTPHFIVPVALLCGAMRAHGQSTGHK